MPDLPPQRSTSTWALIVPSLPELFVVSMHLHSPRLGKSITVVVGEVVGRTKDLLRVFFRLGICSPSWGRFIELRKSKWFVHDCTKYLIWIDLIWTVLFHGDFVTVNRLWSIWVSYVYKGIHPSVMCLMKLPLMAPAWQRRICTCLHIYIYVCMYVYPFVYYIYICLLFVLWSYLFNS